MRATTASLVGTAIVLSLLSPVRLGATDGYFTLGYGTPSQGMGGTGVAIPLGPMSPATNPAGVALGPGGWEFGVGLFNPNRHYEVTGNPSGFPGTFGLAPGTVKSDSPLFVMPNVGVARKVGANGVIGLVMYGNGGMNTTYNSPTFGVSPAGQNLAQMFIAPTYATRFGGRHAVGVTAIIGYQMFEAKGLQGFSAFSSDSKKLTNNGTDSSMGLGLRVGYIGDLTPQFSVGAAYQTKVAMGKFANYAGLFAQGGAFDVPANWTVGAAFKPMAGLTLAVDVQQILYSQVKAVATPLLPALTQAPLGAEGGAGFGWKDMTVVKVGVQQRLQSGLTWRAGYAYGQQPVPSSEVLFNILAPGVIEQHATVGISKDLSARHTLDLAVVRAFNKDVTGPNSLEAPGRQTITLGMDQWVFTVGMTARFK